MTIAEVVELRAVIESLWPNARRLEDAQVRIWHRVLEATTLEDATATAVAFNRQGREWEPTPGMIASAAEPLAGALPYSEAKQLLVTALGRFGAGREAEGLRWLAERSPQTARWASTAWRSLSMDEIQGEYAGPVDQRWRSDYRAVCERMDSERARGRLVPVVSNRLQQLGRASSTVPVNGQLRAVNFAAEFPEQQQIEAGE